MSDPLMTPKLANTTDKLCSLKRDNVEVGGSWILVQEHSVTITNLKNNSNSGSVELTKKVFEAFIRFYETGTTRKAKTKKP